MSDTTVADSLSALGDTARASGDNVAAADHYNDAAKEYDKVAEKVIKQIDSPTESATAKVSDYKDLAGVRAKEAIALDQAAAAAELVAAAAQPGDAGQSEKYPRAGVLRDVAGDTRRRAAHDQVEANGDVAKVQATMIEAVKDWRTAIADYAIAKANEKPSDKAEIKKWENRISDIENKCALVETTLGIKQGTTVARSLGAYL